MIVTFFLLKNLFFLFKSHDYDFAFESLTIVPYACAMLRGSKTAEYNLEGAREYFNFIDIYWKILNYPKDIENIINEHLAREMMVDSNEKVSFRWDVNRGDVGPKDPLDYSDYVGPHVKKLEIKIESD